MGLAVSLLGHQAAGQAATQQELSHYRSSGGTADLWIVVENFNSLFTCDFF